jgi:hypothetical protein
MNSFRLYAWRVGGDGVWSEGTESRATKTKADMGAGVIRFPSFPLTAPFPLVARP